MTIQNGADRLRELRAAFSKLLPTVPGLSLISRDGGKDGATPDRCDVRLVGEHSPEVILIVEPEKAELTAYSEEGQLGTQVIHDNLAIKLTNGFEWDDAYSGTADELAYLLVKHMRRRLKAAGELGADHQ